MSTLSNRDGRSGEHRGFWNPTQYMPFALTQHSIFSRPILIRIREYDPKGTDTPQPKSKEN
jgi:hypothetical protein